MEPDNGPEADFPYELGAHLDKNDVDGDTDGDFFNDTNDLDDDYDSIFDYLTSMTTTMVSGTISKSMQPTTWMMILARTMATSSQEAIVLTTTTMETMLTQMGRILPSRLGPWCQDAWSVTTSCVRR